MKVLKPAPIVADPKTELQRRARDAVRVEAFEKAVEADAWAFYPKGTTGCPFLDEAPNLTKPSDPAREFDREKVHAKYADKLVVIVREYKKEKPSDDPTATLSTYNHAARMFKIKLQDTASKWSILGGSPKLGKDPGLSGIEDVFVADRGGGYVITAPKMVPFFSNMGKQTFMVKIEPDEAKKWTTDGVDLKILIVQRFKRLGFHKKMHEGMQANRQEDSGLSRRSGEPRIRHVLRDRTDWLRSSCEREGGRREAAN